MRELRVFRALFFVLWGVSLAIAQQGAPPAAVSTVPVVQREVAAGQSLVGQVLPSRRSIVGSAVDGRVVDVLVQDGEAVRMLPAEGSDRELGQPIVQLLTETISIEVEAAKAVAELRQQELAELQAGTRAEELSQAKARFEGAEALLEFADAQFNRIKVLHEQSKSATREQLEEAMSVATNARKTQIAAKAAYEMAVAGPRVEQIAQAQARLAAANEDVKRLEDQRRKYTIRAPFAGHVVSKLTEVGAWVARGAPVAEVIALDPVEIQVVVPEVAIPHVKLKSLAQVRVDVLGDQLFTGEVDRVIQQADPRSRAFPVKIRLANPVQPDGSYLLKAGMLARVTLAVGPKQQALLVPKDAIVLGGPSPMVMVVATDPQSKQATAAAVPVQLGVAEGSLIQVSGALKAGQPVIVVGNERVRPGQPVVAAELPTPREQPSRRAETP